MFAPDQDEAEFMRRAHAEEMGEELPPRERYYTFLNEVEGFLGVSLPHADQHKDGYSLDEARRLYDEGRTAHEVALQFREAMKKAQA